MRQIAPVSLDAFRYRYANYKSMNDETPAAASDLNNTPDTGSFRDDALRQGKFRTRANCNSVLGPLVLGIFEDEIATIAEWRRPTPTASSAACVLAWFPFKGACSMLGFAQFIRRNELHVSTSRLGSWLPGG